MIYTVAEYLTAFFEAVMFYMLLDTFCGKRKNVPSYVYYFCIIVLAGLIIISNHIFPYTMFNISSIILCTFFMSLIFDGIVPLKAIISVLGFAIAASFEVLILFVITFIYSVSAAIVVENPSLRLLGIILSKMLAFAIVNIICMVAKRKKIHLGKTYWSLFLLVFLNSILEVFLLYKLAYESSITYMNYMLMICSFGLFLGTFFSFYMCEHMAKQNEIINKQKQYELQLSSQAKHLDDILVNQEALRKFRHDIINHFTAIAGYFKDNDCEEGLKYITDISRIVTSDRQSIKTGNIAFDAIINTKKALADSKGIVFDVNVQIPAKLPIDAADICIVFGNAVDNAIEACEKLPKEERKISLTVAYEDSDILCKLTNSVADSETLSNLKTHKKDKINHGLGIENIKASLAKYNHVFQIDNNGKEFVLEFVIFGK